MKKRSTNLKFNGQFIVSRIGCLEHAMQKKLIKKKITSPKEKIKYIEKLKKQKEKWEKIWKYLNKQLHIKKNSKNIDKIKEAIIMCEQNFKKADQRIENQKKELIKQLQE
ncbi:MAG: hypothetical protein PHP82_01185 [Candidatus ainarchaeum sp.]|nr:hypothetical protein [Candidatus ainarchaeum sp.]